MARNYDYHVVTSSSDYWVDFADYIGASTDAMNDLTNDMMATRVREICGAGSSEERSERAWDNIVRLSEFAPVDLENFVQWLNTIGEEICDA